MLNYFFVYSELRLALRFWYNRNMTNEISIYCDESSHNNSDTGIMALGGIYCSPAYRRKIFRDIRKIKAKHSLNVLYEAKWTKVSIGKIEFYKELIDYFLSIPDLNFRVFIIDKNQLDHERFHQSHDDWYYKMMYLLISKMSNRYRKYNIFLDKKDTRSARKNRKLGDFLASRFGVDIEDMVVDVQSVRSEEVELMQICDVLMGAVAYANKDIAKPSPAKSEIVSHLSKKGYILNETTPITKSKFNVLIWRGRS